MIDFPQWLRDLVGSGPFRCRCGAEIQHPGICDHCSERRDRRRADQLLEQSVSTIPQRFRQCVYGSEVLDERCKPEYQRDSRAIVDSLIFGTVDGAVLVGPKGVGKTSLACAMLRELADKRAHVAWRAVYVRALDLGVSRRDSPLGVRPRAIEEACNASLLLLDDLGQEEDYGPLREVIHSRHDDCKPLVVTTAWDNETLQRRYGEGVDRRLFERAAVLRMGGGNGS